MPGALRLGAAGVWLARLVSDIERCAALAGEELQDDEVTQLASLCRCAWMLLHFQSGLGGPPGSQHVAMLNVNSINHTVSARVAAGQELDGSVPGIPGAMLLRACQDSQEVGLQQHSVQMAGKRRDSVPYTNKAISNVAALEHTPSLRTATCAVFALHALAPPAALRVPLKYLLCSVSSCKRHC